MKDARNFRLKQVLLSKMQSMTEADFTKRILIPLFQKRGYTVDYYGGVAEKGKDLICIRPDEFGGQEIMVAQVKKTRPSAVASDSNSFAAIVTQLQQAAEEPVSLLTVERVPNRVYFITPFQIDIRSLESRYAKMTELSLRNVKVLDGPMIAAAVCSHIPELAEKICGEEHAIKEISLASYSNKDLLSALHYSNLKDVGEFYCDLDFSVGRVTSKLFFSLEFDPKLVAHRVGVMRWHQVANAAKAFRETAGVDVFVSGYASIEDVYAANFDKWKSEENQEIFKKIWNIIGEIENLLRFVIEETGEIATGVLQLGAAQYGFGRTSIRDLTEDERVRLVTLRRAKANLEQDYEVWFQNTEITPTNISRLLGIISAAEKHIESLRNEGIVISVTESTRLVGLIKSVASLNELYTSLEIAVAARTPEPTYDFEIDGRIISERLSKYKEFVKQGASRLTVASITSDDLRAYFLRCQEIFELVEVLLNEKIFSEAAGINNSQKYAINVEAQRIHLPLHDVFATGVNCAVYGEAGAGKSTTLEMFARGAAEKSSSDEITLWLPLTRLLASKTVDEVEGEIQHLETIICAYVGKGPGLSPDSVSKILKSKTRVVFVFDGVDEVLKRAPWVIEAIVMLSEDYPNSQVIISSRTYVEHPALRRFLSLTLLPFTDEQLARFIRGWFGDDRLRSDEIIAHIKARKKLSEIIRNPLLATVLCVLAENRVPLPSSELSMYEERFKLLLGDYDVHKQTTRLETHHTLLEAVARQIAFRMHEMGIRSAKPDVLVAFASKGLGSHRGYSKDQIHRAVEELYDPCTILVPMNNDGAFGFGHLRYQEYLCARELHLNRSIDLLPLLVTEWWRPVIVLFARLCGQIDFIINQVIGQEHTVSKYKDTLLAVIGTRPKNERRYLKSLIVEHLKLDSAAMSMAELKEFASGSDDLDLGIADLNF